MVNITAEFELNRRYTKYGSKFTIDNKNDTDEVDTDGNDTDRKPMEFPLIL